MNHRWWRRRVDDRRWRWRTNDRRWRWLLHLLNGLYDTHMDGAPVVTIASMTFHDLIGTRYQQGIDTTKLMQDVALYNVEVTGSEHAVLVS